MVGYQKETTEGNVAWAFGDCSEVCSVQKAAIGVKGSAPDEELFMVDKNCEILYAYLQTILYDYQAKEIDLTQLDEPFQKLGDSLKILHSGIKHIAWQAEQVVKGDYSQEVSYPEDLTGAFNAIVEKLQEREIQLRQEEERRRKHEAVGIAYNKLLIQLTKRRREWIMVIDRETKELLFCNKKEEKGDGVEDFCSICNYRLSFKQQITSWHSQEAYAIWEAEDFGGNFYQVTSLQTEWQGRKAYAHVIIDITQERQEAKQLASKAYHDPGTGIANRRFFEEYMEQALEEKQEMTLCYMDLDGLKFVNDQYGHLEGDEYLKTFVSLIKLNIRTTDVFARIGGDEFCLVFPGCLEDVAREKLEEALEQMVANNTKEYPVSFSFGVIPIHQDDSDMSLEQILKQADVEMYLCKKQNKIKFHTRQRLQ